MRRLAPPAAETAVAALEAELAGQGACTETAEEYVRRCGILQAALDVLASLEEIDADAGICTPAIPIMHSDD
jgi:hypothetical protein